MPANPETALLVNHAHAARLELLKVWPRGVDCEHIAAREAFKLLDKAEAQAEQLAEALSSMCHQYLRVEDGKLHHDFMSAGEAAFEALDWPDTGQPLSKECLCEVEGCGQGWSCGANGKDGEYHTFCSKHYDEWIKAGNNETAEQHDARWHSDLINSGMSEIDAQAHMANVRQQQQQWMALREKMPEPETPLPQATEKTAAEKVKALADQVTRFDMLAEDGEHLSQVEGKA
jgi:hypothetical protein